MSVGNEPYLICIIFLQTTSIIVNPAEVGSIQLEGLNMKTKSTVTRQSQIHSWYLCSPTVCSRGPHSAPRNSGSTLLFCSLASARRLSPLQEDDGLFLVCLVFHLHDVCAAERPDSGHLHLRTVGQQQAPHDHPGLHHPRAQSLRPEPPRGQVGQNTENTTSWKITLHTCS